MKVNKKGNDEKQKKGQYIQRHSVVELLCKRVDRKKNPSLVKIIKY